MNALLRRFTALRAAPPLSSVISGYVVQISYSPATIAASDLAFCGGGGRGGFAFLRGFHSHGSALGFRESGISCGHAAAVEECYEETSRREDDGLDIAKLGISTEIVSCLAKRGITKLFPIQRAVLEPAMQGKDMIGRAKTGTGKTLAFGIPILDNIIRHNAKHGAGRTPLAIVLAPTRELARQVEKEFRESSSSLETLCVYGGVHIGTQMRTLDRGVDIVVGTPGRVIDLLNRGALDLRDIRYVVLDEADQMLNVGFDKDVEIIMQRLPQKRQNLMFSATMPNWIRRLTANYLRDPATIDLVGESDQKLAEGISLYSIVSDSYSKPSILGPIITEQAKGGKCIVFTQTKRDADRLAYALNRSYPCEALHGDISQNQRERTLAGFRDGRFNILVATDVAARGLDVPNVDLVVHYELPNSSEIFVHRSGRTGRAGKKGTAVLMYTREQSRDLRGIERDVGCSFTELPPVKVDDKDRGMFSAMNMGRSDSYGNERSRFSNSRGFDNFGRNGGRGSFDGFGRYGRPGGSNSSSNSFGRSNGFGGGFASDFGSARSSRDSGFGRFGDPSNGFSSRNSSQSQSDGFQGFGFGSRSSKPSFGDN